MKKQFSAFLLAGMLALSVTACSVQETGGPKEITTLNTASADSAAENTVQTSEESATVQQEVYQITLKTQEISYWTPDRNVELINVSLQTPFLGNNENSAIEKINESFDDGEDDFVSELAKEAYAHYTPLESTGYAETFPTHIYNTYYSVQRMDDTVFSTVKCENRYAGGAHGYSIQSGVNFDMRTGEAIVLSDLSDSQQPRSKLTGHQACNAAELRGM